MKILLLACVLALISCGNQEPLVFEPVQADSIPPQDNIVYETKPDTIKRISLILNDSIKLQYYTESYSGFERWFKKIPTDKIMPPDKAYSEFMSLDDYKAISINFGSEVGQDGFYLLYAYFLQQVNGRKYADERRRITAAYHGINRLKSYYQYGGTYFGHMHDRIFGYAEYSIYKIDSAINNKTDIAAEEKVFISMLKKVYSEKLEEDGDTPVNDKPEKLRKMMKMVDDVGSNITNAYILHEVKRFYDEHYDYWM